MREFFAGPWIGEFGWELFVWHGFLRHMATKFDHVTIACRTGHDLLYADFADNIIYYDPEIEETDMWKNHKESNHHNFFQYYASPDGTPNTMIVHNDVFQSRWWLDELWRKRQDFNSFGVHNNLIEYDVLLIVRNTNKCRSGFRNWPVGHATHFVNVLRGAGLTVACVGKKDSALWIPGTTDCRDCSLETLARVMAHSRVIVGPQCGPIHFATLCLLPQVCWQTHSEHAHRVKVDWNPFKVPVATLPSPNDTYWRGRKVWTPPMDALVTETIQMLNKGATR